MMKARTTVLVAALALGISLEMVSSSCAQGLFVPGEPIRPLDTLFQENAPSQIVSAQHVVEVPGSSISQAQTEGSDQRNVTDVATPPQRAIQRQREELKESLASGGQSASEQRDGLTAEVMNVAQWTSVILIIGSLAAFGLKKFGRNRWVAPASVSALRIVETIPVGRNGGLHLVSIGDERLVVASDNTGIKSVTLLPSWSSEEESLAESESRNPPSAAAPRSSFSKQLASLGGKPPGERRS